MCELETQNSNRRAEAKRRRELETSFLMAEFHFRDFVIAAASCKAF
jgi:hypothetical protein